LQVAQRHDPSELAPGGVGTPGLVWRIAPGDDDQGVARELGQEDVAEPAVEWRQGFVGVDQQHRARRFGEAFRDHVTFGQLEGASQGTEECRWRRLEVAAVE
jgi:hypothetical protein